MASVDDLLTRAQETLEEEAQTRALLTRAKEARRLNATPSACSAKRRRRYRRRPARAPAPTRAFPPIGSPTSASSPTVAMSPTPAARMKSPGRLERVRGVADAADPDGSRQAAENRGAAVMRRAGRKRA